MSHHKRIFKPKPKIWPQVTPVDIWPSKISMRNSGISNESICAKNLSKMVTCVRHIRRKFQFFKSIFSKFRIFLELETKILINFSTPKNPNISFLDQSRNTQKSRCSFSLNPPNITRSLVNYQAPESSRGPPARSVRSGEKWSKITLKNLPNLRFVGSTGALH